MQPLSILNCSVHEAVHLARDMMLTMDEYLALRRLIASERESEGASVVQEAPKKRRRTRSAKANDKKMSQALAQANSELRKINGELRKGVTQSDVMTRAHRIKKGL